MYGKLKKVNKKQRKRGCNICVLLYILQNQKLVISTGCVVGSIYLFY